MTTVKQRTAGDCIICCIAMALSESYDDVMRRMGERGEQMAVRGCQPRDDIEALSLCGMAHGIDFERIVVSPHWSVKEFARSAIWGRRAIITVRNRHDAISDHAVYWDGERLHDPSTRSMYAWSEVEPMEIVVFNERRGTV